MRRGAFFSGVMFGGVVGINPFSGTNLILLGLGGLSIGLGLFRIFS